MKQLFKFLVLTTALSALVADAVTPTAVVSYYKARPQSVNSARKVSGEVGNVHLFDMDDWYGTFWATPSYTRSIRSKRIACCLFGDNISCDNCSTIIVQGSDVYVRDSKALLADNFYLPINFNGTITLEPRISNFIFDFNAYVGLDKWVQGMYFRLYAPFVHTKWDLNFHESVDTAGTAHSAGYFTPQALPRNNLLGSARQYFSGEAPAAVTQNRDITHELDPVTITFKPLCFAQMNENCYKTENGFGEIRAELGWNFWQDADYHFGLNIQGAVPTGTRPKASYLFDAIVGNGKHWEVGAGATGHYVFWRSEDETSHIGFYGDLNVTHLFGARQQRFFDLKDKPLSRYMLAALHTTKAVTVGTGNPAAVSVERELAITRQPVAGDFVPAPFQFAFVYEPVANLTTQDVKVSIGAQVDLSAWVNYTCGNFSWDLGYNLFYSGCEKFSCSDDCPARLCTEKLWALKGDARAFGFNASDATNPNAAVALAFSQKDATIITGTNAPLGADGKNRNFGVDKPEFAASTDSPLLWESGKNFDADQQIKFSNPPTFIKESDINYQSSRGISHKVFGHCAYTWDRAGWVPYVGIGAEAEFGKNECCKSAGCNVCELSSPTACVDPCTCTPACRNCIDCALSQWGVWLKVGFSFE